MKQALTRLYQRKCMIWFGKKSVRRGGENNDATPQGHCPSWIGITFISVEYTHICTKMESLLDRTILYGVYTRTQIRKKWVRIYSYLLWHSLQAISDLMLFEAIYAYSSPPTFRAAAIGSITIWYVRMWCTRQNWTSINVQHLLRRRRRKAEMQLQRISLSLTKTFEHMNMWCVRY